MNRRDILKAVGLAAAGTALLPFDSLAKAASQELNNFQNESFKDVLSSRRKLGRSLEVSAIGLGVQNMSRTYQTTIPNRPEMHNIIRKAFDNGVTLFDAAEA